MPDLSQGRRVASGFASGMDEGKLSNSRGSSKSPSGARVWPDDRMASFVVGAIRLGDSAGKGNVQMSKPAGTARPAQSDHPSALLER